MKNYKNNIYIIKNTLYFFANFYNKKDNLNNKIKYFKNYYSYNFFISNYNKFKKKAKKLIIKLEFILKII